MKQEQKVYSTLADLDIKYIKHEHPPVFTVEQANKHWANITGLHCKNLFLRNKNGKRHYLVIAISSKQVDLKKLNHQLEERLSFASPQRLMKYLGLEPGAVSPFGLINDENKEVKVIVDSELEIADYVNFHPNINTVTLTLSGADFRKFLSSTKNELRYIEI